MIVIGVYLAKTDFKSLITSKSAYLVSIVRLVVIPAVLLFALWAIPESYHEIKLAVFIAGICPVGSNVAVYAQLHGGDYAHAVKTVTASTVLAIVTMPIFISLATLLWV